MAHIFSDAWHAEQAADERAWLDAWARGRALPAQPGGLEADTLTEYLTCLTALV